MLDCNKQFLDLFVGSLGYCVVTQTMLDCNKLFLDLFVGSLGSVNDS
jgi:hypothetical protein